MLREDLPDQRIRERQEKLAAAHEHDAGGARQELHAGQRHVEVLGDVGDANTRLGHA
jgi:hypothetical protein